jgi:hypothetical protein
LPIDFNFEKLIGEKSVEFAPHHVIIQYNGLTKAKLLQSLPVSLAL